MTGDQDRDFPARLAELEATVRGLTQELVSAEERIRQLEHELEQAPPAEAEPATKTSPAGTETEPEGTAEEAPTDDGAELEDIIVA